MNLSFTAIALRNLRAHRARTLLGIGMVALGIAVVIGVELASGAILASLADSPDAQMFMVGLLDQFDQLLALIGLMVSIVTGFLVFNSFLLTVTQRRHQVATLRLLGVTRLQIVYLVLQEGAIIGVLGVLAGLLAGPLLAQGTIGLIKAGLGNEIFTFERVGLSPGDLVGPAVLGFTVTLLAVLLPARHAASLDPLQARRQQAPLRELAKPRRLVLPGILPGVLLLAAFVVLSQGWRPASPWDGWLALSLAALWVIFLAGCLPALIGILGTSTRRLLDRISPGTGRLIADNLKRDRLRVSLIVGSFAMGLALVSALTGLLRFAWVDLFSPRVQSVMAMQAWIVAPFDIDAGMAAYSEMDSIRLPSPLAQDVREALAGQAGVMEWHFALVPELSFFGETYFSFLVDPESLRLAGEAFFKFAEGDWDSAGPIMGSGCGVLISPLVAGRNHLSLGESFSVRGVEGPVTCRVAGIGSPYVGASLISKAAGPSFGVQPNETPPIVLLVWPLSGADRAGVAAELEAVLLRHPTAHLTTIAALTGLQDQVIRSLPVMINGLSLLAFIAAALGVLNTTMLSIVERKRELALLHAVGATLSQVRAVVVGEAALMGLVGAGYGVFAGVGILIIAISMYGGRAWGIVDLDIWGASWRALPPALLNGLVGIIAAPLLSALGAWISWRGQFGKGTALIAALRR